jgi:hypothetical protein
MKADPTILNFHMTLGIGKILALGSFGIGLAMSLYDDEQLKPTFTRTAVTLLVLSGLGGILDQIWSLSEGLSQFFERLGDPGKLFDWIADAYQTSSQKADTRPEASSGLAHAGASLIQKGSTILTQTTRTGVWMVAQIAADFFFAASSKLIEVGRQIFWSLGSFLAPILIGIAPLYPRLGASAILFLLEVSLWSPVLKLMQIVSFPVILKELSNAESLGITVIAAEFISICLFLSVPALVHLLLSGGWSATSMLPALPFRRIPRLAHSPRESSQFDESQKERRR